MKHPWNEVPLSDYESHMEHDDVRQLPLLGAIMKEQFSAYSAETAAVLGVAGGNGLEHIEKTGIRLVYGIDVNPAYLAACRRRFVSLGNRLELLCLDLSAPGAVLPAADLLIANLLVEYIGINAFCRLLRAQPPRALSCVIQKNAENSFVSASPYEASFDGISRIHRDIGPDELIASLKAEGFRLLLKKESPLPHGKSFLRLDFCHDTGGKGV